MKLRVPMALVVVLATITTSTGALAQSWDWHDGYDRGWSDGYHDGEDDGYDRGWDDGWRDHGRHQRRAAYYDYDHDDYYDYDRRSYTYVCKRSSGTGGLVVGALAGSLLGREVSPRDRTAGAIIGGGVGALAGRALDRSQSRC